VAVIRGLQDRKGLQARKAFLASKVRPVRRVPLGRPDLPGRREKPVCKDPQALRASAAKSAHPDHRVKREPRERRDQPDRRANVAR